MPMKNVSMILWTPSCCMQCSVAVLLYAMQLLISLPALRSAACCAPPSSCILSAQAPNAQPQQRTSETRCSEQRDFSQLASSDALPWLEDGAGGDRLRCICICVWQGLQLSDLCSKCTQAGIGVLLLTVHCLPGRPAQQEAARSAAAAYTAATLLLSTLLRVR